jgi:hypothetical protein
MPEVANIHERRAAGPAPARLDDALPRPAEHLDTGATLAITSPREGKVFPDGSDVPIWEALMTAMT